MKKLSLLLLTVLVVFYSCSKNEPGIKDEGEKNVEMTFYSPSTYALYEETSAEKQIMELDILVFDKPGDNGKFLYRRYAWKKSDQSYRSTLKIGEDFTLYFVINSRALLDSSPELQENNTWGEIRKSLVMNDPSYFNQPDNGLPMWGMLHDVDIKDIAVNYLGTVDLIRSVASVDLIIDTDPTEFKFTHGFIYFVSDKGLLPFSESNLETIGGVSQLKGPECPAGMRTDYRMEYQVPSGDMAIKNKLYIYENDTDSPSQNTNRQSRVVIGGNFKSGAVTTFYPLDFLDENDNQLKVTRNNKYVLVVSKVNGDGYGDPDTAADAKSMNIDYKVIPWNDNVDEDIIIDGPNYISLRRKYATLFRPQGSADSIIINTNIPLDEFKMKFNSSDPESVNAVENTRFKVEVLKNADGVSYFRIVAKENYGFDSNNKQSLMVTAGRIEFIITITQLNSLPSDWNNGGNQDETLGQ